MKIITLEGEPLCQIRMRFSSRGGFVKVYDPRHKAKKEIKAEIEKQFGLTNQVSHPRISFVFHMPIPKSTPKREHINHFSGQLKHEKKPDVDNLIKLYLDCMNEICFKGDQEVSLGPCVKLYHPFPKTIIFIQELDQILTPQELDPAVWAYLSDLKYGESSLVEKVSPLDLSVPPLLEPYKSSLAAIRYQRIDTLA